MQNGRLLAAGSHRDPAQRFRAVSVTLSAVKELPAPAARGLAGCCRKSKVTACASSRPTTENDQQLYQQLTQHFGAVKMECEPMALRAIANALMQQRKAEPASE